MRSAELVTNRRGVLLGGAALAALGLGTSGCHETPAGKPASGGAEELQGPLDQARHDSELAAAAAAAVGAPPQVAAALSVVANQRTAHAQALSTEIARASGKLVTSPTDTPRPSPPGAKPPQPGAKPAPPLADVVNSLRASAESAARLVASSSGYRAGLLGSIAASCTASYMVALTPGKPGT